MAVRKLRCPKCRAVFDEGTTICPGCGIAILPRGLPGPAAARTRLNQIRALLFLVGLGLVIFGFVVWPAINRQTASAPAAPVGNVTVEYKLTGTATTADLTYTNASGNIEQQTSVYLSSLAAHPVTFRVAHSQYVSFSAQNDSDSGDLTCSIVAGGVVINTGHSSGGYAIVSCSAVVP